MWVYDSTPQPERGVRILPPSACPAPGCRQWAPCRQGWRYRASCSQRRCLALDGKGRGPLGAGVCPGVGTRPASWLQALDRPCWGSWRPLGSPSPTQRDCVMGGEDRGRGAGVMRGPRPSKATALTASSASRPDGTGAICHGRAQNLQHTQNLWLSHCPSSHGFETSRDPPLTLVQTSE